MVAATNALRKSLPVASAARRSRTADISGPLTTHEWPLRSHLVRRKFAAVHLSHPAE